MPAAIIIGAGPGIGQAVATRFAREGFAISLIARHDSTVSAVAAVLAGFGVPVQKLTADVAEERQLRAALDRSQDAHGVPEVVVYNVGLIRTDEPGQLSYDEQREAWTVNVLGALNAAVHSAPRMAAAGGGSFIVTGGMPKPVAARTSLSLGKAGVRTLVALLDEHYGPAGVHVATVTVGGGVAAGTDRDPDEIAEHYWRLSRQAPSSWELEVRHG